MRKYKIEIKDLGRNHISLSKIVRKIDYPTLYNIVKPYLLSSNISFSAAEGEWGTVFAGFHTVGKITFNKVEEEL